VFVVVALLVSIRAARGQDMELNIEGWLNGWRKEPAYIQNRASFAWKHLQADGDASHFLRRLVNAPFPYGSYRNILPRFRPAVLR